MDAGMNNDLYGLNDYNSNMDNMDQGMYNGLSGYEMENPDIDAINRMNRNMPNMDDGRMPEMDNDGNFMFGYDDPADPAQDFIMGARCYGRDAEKYASQLLEYINDEFRDSLYYATLARRAPTQNARRILRNISQDELRHSRRFGAAYFLITGKRYVPTATTVEPVVVPTSFNQALRQRYMAESRDMIKYRQFAQQTTDRCLRRIATDTSNDERQHAQLLLELLQTTR